MVIYLLYQKNSNVLGESCTSVFFTKTDQSSVQACTKFEIFRFQEMFIAHKRKKKNVKNVKRTY